jgi:hypothetical protein
MGRPPVSTLRASVVAFALQFFNRFGFLLAAHANQYPITAPISPKYEHASYQEVKDCQRGCEHSAMRADYTQDARCPRKGRAARR